MRTARKGEHIYPCPPEFKRPVCGPDLNLHLCEIGLVLPVHSGAGEQTKDKHKMQNKKQPIHPSNMYSFRQIAVEILRQTVVVKCPDTMYGIMLFVFFNATDEQRVSALFEQVGLRVAPLKNWSAYEGLRKANWFYEELMGFLRSTTDLFNLSQHLQVQKHELGGFIIIRQDNPNSDAVVKNLTKSFSVIGRSESKTIPMQQQKPVACTAYFSR